MRHACSTPPLHLQGTAFDWWNTFIHLYRKSRDLRMKCLWPIKRERIFAILRFSHGKDRSVRPCILDTKLLLSILIDIYILWIELCWHYFLFDFESNKMGLFELHIYVLSICPLNSSTWHLCACVRNKRFKDLWPHSIQPSLSLVIDNWVRK